MSISSYSFSHLFSMSLNIEMKYPLVSKPMKKTGGNSSKRRWNISNDILITFFPIQLVQPMKRKFRTIRFYNFVFKVWWSIPVNMQSEMWNEFDNISQFALLQIQIRANNFGLIFSELLHISSHSTFIINWILDLEFYVATFKLKNFSKYLYILWSNTNRHCYS